MGTFFKLPNELVSEIFDELDKACLLTLAKSCKHLNVAVIDYYLSRYHRHLLNPSDGMHLVLGRDFDALPFLRIATQLTSTPHLRAYFTDKGHLDEIRGLEGLVAKLSSVRSVRLNLSMVGAIWYPDDEARFVKAIRSLLNTIIARSCETLYIGNGPSLRHSYHSNSQKKPRRTGLSTLSRGFTAPLQRMLGIIRSATESPDSFPNTSHLAKLQIYSGPFFDRSFLHWTIHLINASPITSLTLECSRSKTTVDWDEFLSAIHSGALSEFCIQDKFCQLPLTSVAAFLARHPTITSLECQGLFQDDAQYCQFLLPWLTQLTSSCESIVYLLEDVTAFPSLRDISLDILPTYAKIDLRAVNDALKCIGRCPNEVELSFTFHRMDKDLLGWLEVDADAKDRAERLLHQVVRLTIIITFSPLVPSKWLSLFPGLRFVTFRYDPSTETATVFNVARSIIQACPQLETLTVNEETHAVTTWLGSDSRRLQTD